MIIRLLALLTAFALPLCLVWSSAYAQTIRGDVTVSDPIVTLGDLITDAGPSASLPVFRAPAIGESGVVSVSRIVDAASRAGIRPEASVLDRITVTRDSRTVSRMDIQDLVQVAFEDLGLYADLDVSADVLLRNLPRDVVLDPSFQSEPIISDFRFDRRTGQFSAVMQIDDGAQAYRKSLTGSVTFHRDVPVFATALDPDTIISSSDIAMDRRRMTMTEMNAPRSNAMDVTDMIGKAVRRRVSANSVVRDRDLMEPRLVRRNEVITAIYTAGPIQVTTKMRALADGPLGAVVPVLNLKSKRIVDAEVVSNGLVRVASQGGALLGRRDLAALLPGQDRQ
ncbi:MAG: flagellar basal body P-ring formation chaperone FlgA [Pseudomonadota bacterium]